MGTLLGLPFKVLSCAMLTWSLSCDPQPDFRLPDYGSKEYWDERFQGQAKSGTQEDWYPFALLSVMYCLGADRTDCPLPLFHFR